MPAIVVVAIDGLVLDTVTLRARALQASLEGEGVVVALPQLTDTMPGRALTEVIDECAPALDPIAREVVALRAQQIISREMSVGIVVQPDATEWISGLLARGVRVIGRADSTRDDIDRVLPLLSFSDALVFVRCADDSAVRSGALRTGNMLERAYDAIVTRVTQRWPDAAMTAYELTDAAANTAGRLMRAVACASLRPS